MQYVMCCSYEVFFLLIMRPDKVVLSPDTQNFKRWLKLEELKFKLIHKHVRGSTLSLEEMSKVSALMLELSFD